MFVIPAIAALLTFVYLRPQEVFEILRPLALSGLVGVFAYTYALDLRLGYVRPKGSPLLYALLALFALCVLTIVVKVPDRLTDLMGVLGTSTIVFIAVAEGVQGFRALEAAAVIIVALTIVISAVGVHQGFQPFVCYQRTGGDTGNGAGDILDGRPCNKIEQCEEGDLVGHDWLCERPGLMGTHSIGGRVRFRGLLEDPNELCLALCMGAPLALGLFERRKSRLRRLLVFVTFAVVLPCIVMTRSRSGQLAMLAALGVYFVRRFGRRGLVVAGALAVPLLLLGGRSGAEADSSSEERLECWAEAINMWRENPLIGVGQGQFGEHHYLTAHNAYLLALAELGPLGLLLFSGLIYMALKMTVRAQVDFARRPEASAALAWASALTASLVGLAVSAFFLSVAYHTILWMFLGLVASFYAAMRKHEPTWRVTFGLRDLLFVAGVDIGVVALLAVYLRLKGEF
jgi:hypothetical protein